MQQDQDQKQKPGRKPKEDILKIVKEFISYFEEADRSEKDGNSIKHS